MNFLKKIFGQAGKDEPAGTPGAQAPDAAAVAPQPSAPAPAPAQPAPAAAPPRDAIRVFDEHGRELLIAREEWIKNVLPGALQKEWDHPDGLASIILQSLDDGLAAHVVEAAEQLHDIDANMERGGILRGLVLMENGRYAEAAEIFKGVEEEHGVSAPALANLAEAQEKLGDAAGAKATRWRALTVDPNQEQALARYANRARAEGGEAGFQEAMRRVDALPGSWRARIGLGAGALAAGDRERGVAVFRHILEHNPDIGVEPLVQMSGELGKAGALEAIVDLFTPVFHPQRHGMPLGNNLIKANLDLGRLDAAKGILESLYAQQRPDWRENLAFWQAEIDNRTRGFGSAVPEGALQIAVMPLTGPIWARKQEGFAELVPPKRQGAPHIGIVAPTVSNAARPQAEGAQVQREDQAGLFSRALAVYLAERIHMDTGASGTALMLGLKDRGGFVLGGAPYPREQVIQMATLSGPAPCGFVCDAHIDVPAAAGAGAQWSLKLTLLDTATGAEAAVFAGEADPEDPMAALETLAADLCAFVRKLEGGQADAAPAWYAAPNGGRSPHALFARVQTLVVATAALHKGRDSGLYGERQILDGLFLFAAENSRDPVARLLLITALSRHKEMGTAIYKEYAERVIRLGRQAPLPGDVQAKLEAASAKLFA
jgi:tetratricopeptide (TPR) repeat protein